MREERDMKVKIGDKIYNSDNEPIMIIISQKEKEQIANMHPDNLKYCVFPSIDKWIKNDYKGIKQWMSGFKIIKKGGGKT